MKPDWHDRPTEPGLWLVEYPFDERPPKRLAHLSKYDDKDLELLGESWFIGKRFFGPIPRYATAKMK